MKGFTDTTKMTMGHRFGAAAKGPVGSAMSMGNTTPTFPMAPGMPAKAAPGALTPQMTMGSMGMSKAPSMVPKAMPAAKPMAMGKWGVNPKMPK